jgi:AcrR family transcriptional regulator
MIETKQKILDTAEQLFGEQGYGATSLRQIIAAAGVNLAAIHYHFGSKEELLDQIILRKAEPVNRERLEMLERFEAEAGGGPVAVEKILEAFLTPAIARVAVNPGFSKLSGRLLGEGLMPAIVEKHFRHVAIRFTGALARALPELSPVELEWRGFFVIGTMAHTMCSKPQTNASLEGMEAWKVLRRLVAFLSGGLRAPATETSGTEVNR